MNSKPGGTCLKDSRGIKHIYIYIYIKSKYKDISYDISCDVIMLLWKWVFTTRTCHWVGLLKPGEPRSSGCWMALGPGDEPYQGKACCWASREAVEPVVEKGGYHPTFGVSPFSHIFPYFPIEVAFSHTFPIALASCFGCSNFRRAQLLAAPCWEKNRPMARPRLNGNPLLRTAASRRQPWWCWLDVERFLVDFSIHLKGFGWANYKFV